MVSINIKSSYIQIKAPDAMRTIPLEIMARAADGVREARQAGKEVVDLCLGAPLKTKPEGLIRETKGILDELGPDSNALSVYPKAGGYPLYKKGVAWLIEQTYGVRIQKDSLIDNPDSASDISLDSNTGMVSANGGSNALTSIIQAFGGMALEEKIQPFNFIYFTPGYPAPLDIAIGMYGKLINPIEARLKINNGCIEGFDLSNEALKVLKKNKLPSIAIFNSPHNPTGAIANQDFYNSLKELYEKYGVVLVNDDPYSAICFERIKGSRYKDSSYRIHGLPNLGIGITTFSATKVFASPDARIGALFTTSNEPKGIENRIIERVEVLKKFGEIGSNVPGELGLQNWMQNSPNDVLEYLHKTTAMYYNLQQFATNKLREAGCKIDITPAGLYLWVGLPEAFNKYSSLQIAEMLRNNYSVHTIPKQAFLGLTSIQEVEEDERRLRISLRPDNILDKGLDRIEKFIRNEGKNGI